MPPTPLVRIGHRNRCILGGTDIEMKNAAGCTAAHAAATNGHQELMELLNEKGADLNFKCHNTGKTPLMLAAKKGVRSSTPFHPRPPFHPLPCRLLPARQSAV